MKVTLKVSPPRIREVRIPGDNLATAYRWLHQNRWTVYSLGFQAKVIKKGDKAEKVELTNKPTGDRPAWAAVRRAQPDQKDAWEKFLKGLEKIEGDFVKLCDAELQNFKKKLSNESQMNFRDAQEKIAKFEADLEKKIEAYKRGGGNWGRLTRLLERVM